MGTRRVSRLGERLIARLRSLSRKHATGLVVVVLLCAAVIAASATGRTGVAVSLLALLVAAVLAGVVHLSRFLGGVHRANQAAHRELRVTVEALQRRLVAAVERERLTAGDRHLELTDLVAHAERVLDRDAKRVEQSVPREVEALLQLFRDFTPRAPMPESGGWALNPTDLLDLLHLIDSRRPQLVVELGSGTSSVWIGYAVEKFGGQLVSLEHDRTYAERTRAALAEHELTAVAEVRDAPLAPFTADGKTQWYDTSALAGLDDIDLLLVDGPPAATGPDARHPALPALAARLAARATIVVDDADRPDEQAAVQHWLATVDGLTVQDRTRGRHTVLAYARTAETRAPAHSR